MGKVGSSTIKLTLDRLNLFQSHQVHRLNPDNIARVKREHESRGWAPPAGDLNGLELYERIIKTRAPAKIITLVREPIGRNFSYYFQNLDKICGTPDAHASIPTEQLVRDFPVEFPYSDDPLTWFEYEFKEVLGLDLYSYELNMGRGFAEVKSDLYDILILRTDTADEIKSEALAKFLEVSRAPLVQANITAHKEQAKAYRKFGNSIQMVPAYLDHMLGSKYSCLFFDEKDLSRWRDEYARIGSIVPSSFLELQRNRLDQRMKDKG
ncbi:MAG: putative capsular polysaccharide synthesis family protein [Pyrinomonadaceae bacterium]